MEDRKYNRLIWVAITLIAIIAAGGLGLWLKIKTTHHTKPIQIANGTVLSTPYKIKPFQLIDQNGKPFTQANLKGHWSMLFFGFTRCPMVCPTTLAKLNKAYHYLQQHGLRKNLPQVVFISIDPERDTSAVIKKYIKAFNPNFKALTGTTTQIKDFTKQLGIVYAKAMKSEESDYTMNHSGAILIINTAGKWSAILSSPFKAVSIAEDFKRIQIRN